jgi:predicted PurR-regulated permease PerM
MSELAIARPRPALLAIALVAVLAILLLAGSALSPFIIGFIFVAVALPVVDAAEHRGAPRWAAIIATFAVTAVGVVVVVLLVAGPIARQVAALAVALPSAVGDLASSLNALLDRIGATSPDVAATLQQIGTRIAGAGASLAGSLVGGIVQVGFDTLGAILAFLVVPFWVFFVLNDAPNLSGKLRRRLPAEWADPIEGVASIAVGSFGRWAAAQLRASIAAAVYAFVQFTLLGVLVDPVFGHFAVLLAMLAFILEFIPNIGPTIALIPALLIGLPTGLGGEIAVVVGWIIGQQLENSVIIPRIQGQANDLHPAVILVVLVVGGAIAGVLGLIIAVPTTATAVRIFDYFLARSGGIEADAPSEPVPGAAVLAPEVE